MTDPPYPGLTRLGRAAKFPASAQEAFESPMCRILYELGGRSPARKVLELIPARMKDTLTDFDFQAIPSGGERWHKTANWAWFAPARKGYIRTDSERGYWELSEAVRRHQQVLLEAWDGYFGTKR